MTTNYMLLPRMYQLSEAAIRLGMYKNNCVYTGSTKKIIKGFLVCRKGHGFDGIQTLTEKGLAQKKANCERKFICIDIS